MGIAAAETIIAWQSHEGPRIARAGGHDIIQCVMCGFRHIVPLPEPRAFEHTYRDVYARDPSSGISSALSDDQIWSEVAHADLLESFERLLAHDPGYVGSYYHLAKLLERTGMNEEAIGVYEKGMAAATAAGDKHALGELRAAYEELTL